MHVYYVTVFYDYSKNITHVIGLRAAITRSAGFKFMLKFKPMRAHLPTPFPMYNIVTVKVKAES